jgi:hypothetical protein
MYNFMQINKFLPFLASILNRASLYAATVQRFHGDDLHRLKASAIIRGKAT